MLTDKMCLSFNDCSPFEALLKPQALCRSFPAHTLPPLPVRNSGRYRTPCFLLEILKPLGIVITDFQIDL